MDSHDHVFPMSRRELLKKTMAAGALLSTAADSGAETIRFKRTSPNDLITIGALSCGAGTHTQSLWAPLINAVGKTRTTGMVITHCWDVLENQEFEFTRDVQVVKEQVKDWKITGYTADNSMSDYSTHGVHGLWMCLKVIDDPVVSAAYITPDWKVPNGLVVADSARSGTQ